MNKSLFFYIIIIICSFNALAYCQTSDVLVETNTVSDSTEYVPQTNRYGLLSSFSGKPGRAALIGLMVPAGGQFYNRRFIKGTIFLAAELAGIYYALDRSSYYNQVDDCYKTLLTTGECTDPTFANVELTTLRNHRESVRESRDFAWLGLIIGHVFIVAEAFVDRHLMRFNVNEDLSIELKAFDNGHLLSLSIPLR